MNNGHLWTVAEEDLIKAEYAKKKPSESAGDFYHRVGVRLGVSGGAVRMKIQEEGWRKTIRQASPNILLLDIETLHMLVYTHQLRDTYIPHEAIEKDWCISSWAAKWVGDDKPFGASVTSDEAIARDDYRILKPLLKVLDRADVIIAHNGKRFDVKRINTRLFQNGMPLPLKFYTLDTLTESRAVFDFPSFKLDYVTKANHLNTGKSEDHGDIYACSRGEARALRARYKYNLQDVQIMEDYFYTVLPYIQRPAFASWYGAVIELEGDETACPLCGEVINDSKMSAKAWISPAGYKYQQFRCKCGAIGRKNSRKYQPQKSGKRL